MAKATKINPAKFIRDVTQLYDRVEQGLHPQLVDAQADLQRRLDARLGPRTPPASKKKR